MLVTELKQARSPRAPYYNTLPTPTEVFSYYEMPVEYAPIIQHAATVSDLERKVGGWVGADCLLRLQGTNSQVCELAAMAGDTALVDTAHMSDGSATLPT